MVKFPQMRHKHTNNVQLPAIFNQTTSLQWSYSLVLVHENISVLICNAKTFKIVLQVSWQPPHFFFFLAVSTYLCFIHNEWVSRLLFKGHTVMHFSLSSSSTCCDTDLERSSCCRPERRFDKKAAFQFAQKGEETQIKMLLQKQKSIRKCKLLHLLCIYRAQGGLWVPLTPWEGAATG